MEKHVQLGRQVVDLSDAKRFTQAHAADWRAIDRLVWGEEFCWAWEQAGPRERQTVQDALVLGDRVAVFKWFKEQRAKKLEGKSIRELRHIAKGKNVNNYHSLSKDELIVELGGAA